MAGMVDEIVRCLLRDPPVRVVSTVTTDVADELARRHGAVGGAQVALGRGATCGLLLATLTKGGEQVTLQVLGSGPFGPLLVDAFDNGDVRAYLKHPEILVPGPPGRRVSVAAGIGRWGMVNVVRDLGLRQPVSGQSPLRSGEVDEDVEEYLCVSEQLDSALGCEVLLGDSEVTASAGVLVQCMPGGDASGLVASARERLRGGAVATALASGGLDAVELARLMVGERRDDLEVLDTRPVGFHCPCSPERVQALLVLLSDEDLEEMIEEEDEVEITCNFCSEVYSAATEDLEEARATRASRASS